MTVRAVIHALTPGDHYSPSTGSAVPTVVHGLAAAARSVDPGRAQYVLVADGTYPDRYDSATPIGYPTRPGPTGLARLADRAIGRIAGARPWSRAELRPLVAGQRGWPPGFVLAHNLVELTALIDPRRHRPVLYAHNDLLRRYARPGLARTLAHAAAIVCVSEFLADQLAATLPRSLHDRLAVVVNGVDCETFRPAATPAEHDGVVVGFVGRMIPDKGADVLIRAAGRLASRDLRLTIVGSAGFDARAPLTGYERELRRTAAELGVPCDFRPFTDRRRLPELLRSFDALVVPSRWPDPCPLAVGEGLATGLPVIASRAGGIPEALGGAGALVPPGDEAALAEQLERLADPVERRQLGAAARHHAERHDWSWAWRCLAAIFDRIDRP